MAETREDNGWWADMDMVYDAEGDGVCECYQCQRFDNDEERIERARERARRIARLPELEEAAGQLLDVLAYIFADYDIMTEEDGDDWPELREALARVSRLLYPQEP